MNSKTILPSPDIHGDAVMGKGAYLTKLDPTNSRPDVAKNNYDNNLWESKLQDGKVNVCFEMKLPKILVQDCSLQLGRDVHLHPGIINLSQVKDMKVYYFTSDTTYKTIFPV
jgi:hypothetical protein